MLNTRAKIHFKDSKKQLQAFESQSIAALSCLTRARTPNGVIVCRTYANNATSAEKKALVYRPRLTLIKQLGREEYLKLEFSAQTVLLGNTLQEVSEDDFERDLKL